jgi:transcriptional regulator with XRE-family HTH domain
MTSDPFPEAMLALMQQRGVSTRKLSEKTRDMFNGWGAQVTIHRLSTGEVPATIEAIERIARALEVDPDYFAEYRLAMFRAQFDPEQVSLRVALANLDRYENR